MLKEFIWNTFERTGEVDFYMFYKEIEVKNRGMSESRTTADEAAISDLFKDVAVPV